MMSNMGRVHGSILFTKVPGKNPISSSSTGTMGRVRTIFSMLPRLSCSRAVRQANRVLPHPAGPIPKTMDVSGLFKYFW